MTDVVPENVLEVCPQIPLNRAKNRKGNQENTGKLHPQVMILVPGKVYHLKALIDKGVVALLSIAMLFLNFIFK